MRTFTLMDECLFSYTPYGVCPFAMIETVIMPYESGTENFA